MKNKFSFFLGSVLLLAACNSNDAVKKVDVVATKTDSQAVTSSDSLLAEDTLVMDTAGSTSKAVQLKFNLQKGKTYAYTMDLDMEQNMQDRKMNTGMNWKYTMTVVDDNGRVQTLKTTYDRVAMSMDMGGQKMEFSSDKGGGEATNPLNMVSNMFAAMKGKSFFMKVNKKGEITAVEGFDKIGEALVKEMNVPEEARARILQNFKSQFNDESVKQTFSQSFDIFPAKPVNPGDSWQKETTTKLGPAKGRMTTTYTVKQITGNKVILNAVSNVTGAENNKGTQTARLVVDAITGLVQQNIFEMKMEGDHKMTSKGKIIAREL